VPQPTPLPRRRWSAPVHAALGTLLNDAHRGSTAALDWDETTSKGDISLALLADMDPRGALRSEYERREQEDVPASWRWLAKTLLVGKTPAEVSRWTQAVYARREDVCVVPEMRDLIASLHARAWTVWVVTGSPGPVVSALGHVAGIPPSKVLGIEAKLDANGRYLPELLEPITEGAGKLEVLRSRTSEPIALSAGDRPSDLHLLREARIPIIVDRGERILQAEARARGWLLQEAW
jgi:phosphoserine phosphatase